MLHSIKNFLSPPLFVDREKESSARMFHVILLASLGILMVFVVPMGLLIDTLNILVFSVLFSGTLTAFVLNKRGYVRTTAAVYLAFFYVLIVAEAIFTDGLLSGGLIFLVAMVFVAGSILGTQIAAMYSIASIAGLFLLHIGELNGHIASGHAHEVYSSSILASFIIAILVMGIFTHLTMDNFHQSMTEARQHQQALNQTIQKPAAIKRLERNARRWQLVLSRWIYEVPGSSVCPACFVTHVEAMSPPGCCVSDEAGHACCKRDSNASRR